MSTPLEDYAFLSDRRSSALVDRLGSVDWMCTPDFDSAPCFAALLGTRENGHWSITPVDHVSSTRRYLDGSLVLETRHRCGAGEARVVDGLVHDDEGRSRLLRRVRGERGRVRFRQEMRLRFDHGSLVPWVNRADDHTLVAIGGADAAVVRSDVPLHGEGPATVGEFTVAEGDEVSFDLCWFPSWERPPASANTTALLEAELDAWRSWSEQQAYSGAWSTEVHDSLRVLRGLVDRRTGGIIAAATSSLPERPGGDRNWDYRYCWLRDATFTLLAFLESGQVEEAAAWRRWLLRAAGGDLSTLRILYGVRGDRQVLEWDVPWLQGYASSTPVRMGNAAHSQSQLDVYGEVVDALHHGRANGLELADDAWALQTLLLEHVEEAWSRPDAGIWEMRSEPRHFTHSKIQAWVAADRMVRSIESGMSGDADRWRVLRTRIHGDVMANGVRPDGVFRQSYGDDTVDASALLAPLVGFVPFDDPTVAATVAAVERELCEGGLVHRYAHHVDDGVGGGEGAFLACSFWLVQVYAGMGREAAGRELFERLLDLRNDVGLLSEEYDPRSGRLVGNIPQAFSHVGLVHAAAWLCDRTDAHATRRAERRDDGA